LQVHTHPQVAPLQGPLQHITLARRNRPRRRPSSWSQGITGALCLGQNRLSAVRYLEIEVNDIEIAEKINI
jgi:hypothetical protein